MIVDCDVHCAPASIEALFPYLDEHWRSFVDVAGLGLPYALGAMYPPGARTTGGSATSLAALQEQALDPRGVDRAVLVCMTGFDTLRNTYYAADMMRATNDWVGAEWLDRDPRLRGSIAVTTLDPDAAVEEVDRLGGDPRFVQVLLPVRADTLYGNKRYHRLFEAIARHDLVVALHAWGLSGTQPTPNGFSEHYLEDYVAHTIIAQSHLTSMIVEGVFEKVPGLRVSLLECGAAWLPAFLWRLDKDWKGIRREVPWVSRRPSETLREALRLGLEPLHAPADIGQLVDLLAMLRWPELLMYSSDHPHVHGDGGARYLAAVDEEQRTAIMGATAARHYDFAEVTA